MGLRCGNKTIFAVILEKLFVIRISKLNVKFILINPLAWVVIIVLFIVTPIVCMITDATAKEYVSSIIETIKRK